MSKKEKSHLTKKLVEQFAKMPKSKQNLYISSLEYEVTVRGKKRTQFISNISAKLRNLQDAQEYIETFFDFITDKLEDYLLKGMSGIKIIGVKTQGYF